jgi:isoquinoline 1-oxidoreductase beta subunit
MSTNLSRRLFLQSAGAAGAGLIIGCHVPPPEDAAKKTPPADPTTAKPAEAKKPGETFAPNAWVRVAPDNTVTVIIDKAEMGQGIETALPMLVAEELEVDVAGIRTEFAPPDPVYKNPLFGMQATGGSTSVRGSYKPLREAGAAARIMLIGAAARAWGVEESSCRAESGHVIHPPTKRRLSYGELAADAAKSPVPKEVKLKDPKDFKVVGKPQRRIDGRAKAMGRAEFGIDVKQPDMLVAVVARCPVFGGKVKSFDASKATAVKGVKKVVQIGSGVAVVATGFWPARQGAAALDIKWDEGANAKNSTEKIREAAIAMAKKPGKEAAKKGDFEKAFKGAAKKVTAVYDAPFQAHAAMEPLACTAVVRKDGCTIWAPTQSVQFVQGVAMKLTGLPKESITIHTMFLGGAFGRKFEQDFIIEAIEVAKELAGTPVKLVWSREDDMRHDFYRPCSYNEFSAGLGKDGMPVAWSHRIVGPSIMTRVFPNQVKDGLDHSSVEGAADMPYGVPNVRVDYHLQDAGVPVGFWRSVGHSQNAFVVECFIDELAAAAKQDPFEYRRKLLEKQPRMKAVLELAAAKAGWGKPVAKGKGRGIAVAESFGSFVAQVADVTVDADGKVKVDRVVCAVDCGAIVNPDTIEAQMEGGIAYGLTAALKSSITIENGGVKQANFHNFRLLEVSEMPVVEVHIVPSTEASGGVGEPGTPPIAPAVANAVFAATGKRLRSLPLRVKDAK